MKNSIYFKALEKYGSMTFHRYAKTERLCIRFEDVDTGAQLFTLTVNVPEIVLREDEFIIKVYTENKIIIDDVIKSGWFEATTRDGIKQPTLTKFPIWVFTKKGRNVIAAYSILRRDIICKK